MMGNIYREQAYTAEKLDTLRDMLIKSGEMGEKRLRHTLGVEAECGRLAELFGLSENDALRLRAAGLLHDITKELALPEQIELCKRYELDYPPEATHSPRVFHAWTASAVMLDRYPEYADAEMSGAVYSHTTGSRNMSLFDALLFLADYIEPERTFPDCVALREYFYTPRGGELSAMPREALLQHLIDTLVLSFDMTLRQLITDGEFIFHTTVEARNALLYARDKSRKEDRA